MNIGLFSQRNRLSLLIGKRDVLPPELDPSLDLNGTLISRWSSKAGLDAQAEKQFAIRLWGEILAILLLGVLIDLRAILLFPVILGFEFVNLWRKVKNRVQSFEKDYTALLLSLAASVRTGLDPIVALHRSAALFTPGSAVRSEIEKFGQRLDRGISEEIAIRRFADTIPHPDIRLFRTALLLSRREGSSLGECLQRLVKVTRQRQSFRRKIKAALAMQKLSAFGIAGCTGVITAIQASTNSQAFIQAWNHPVGQKILGFGMLLIVVGVVWMLGLSSRKV